MIPQQAHDEMRWMDPEHDPIRCVCCCWDCDIEEDDLAEDRAERVTKWMREPEAGIGVGDCDIEEDADVVASPR